MALTKDVRVFLLALLLVASPFLKGLLDFQIVDLCQIHASASACTCMQLRLFRSVKFGPVLLFLLILAQFFGSWVCIRFLSYWFWVIRLCDGYSLAFIPVSRSQKFQFGFLFDQADIMTWFLYYVQLLSNLNFSLKGIGFDSFYADLGWF